MDVWFTPEQMQEIKFHKGKEYKVSKESLKRTEILINQAKDYALIRREDIIEDYHPWELDEDYDAPK